LAQREAQMASMTATAAKRRFGRLLALAKTEPVHIQKNGSDIAVMISHEVYDRLVSARRTAGVRPEIEALLADSIEKRGSVYKALAKLDTSN
jgi:prevent-host-death family protein